jgi:hypothetical protein
LHKRCESSYNNMMTAKKKQTGSKKPRRESDPDKKVDQAVEEWVRRPWLTSTRPELFPSVRVYKRSRFKSSEQVSDFLQKEISYDLVIPENSVSRHMADEIIRLLGSQWVGPYEDEVEERFGYFGERITEVDEFAPGEDHYPQEYLKVGMLLEACGYSDLGGLIKGVPLEHGLIDECWWLFFIHPVIRLLVVNEEERDETVKGLLERLPSLLIAARTDDPPVGANYTNLGLHFFRAFLMQMDYSELAGCFEFKDFDRRLTCQEYVRSFVLPRAIGMLDEGMDRTAQNSEHLEDAEEGGGGEKETVWFSSGLERARFRGETFVIYKTRATVTHRVIKRLYDMRSDDPENRILMTELVDECNNRRKKKVRKTPRALLDMVGTQGDDAEGLRKFLASVIEEVERGQVDNNRREFGVSRVRLNTNFVYEIDPEL